MNPSPLARSLAPVTLFVAAACLTRVWAAVPDVVIVSIDTLRADRVSSYGYHRETTPNLDPRVHGGVRFAEARTVEPLTNPALASMLTSVYPHVHGASRNGLRLRSGLVSLPGALEAQGYRTAAFVGNWTLRHKLSGLAEHFETYEECLTRKRWFGLVRREATAEDITESTLEWIAEHTRTRRSEPYMVWAHYVDPHAPYRTHDEFAERLGLTRPFSPSDRYDTEISYADDAIGKLLDGLEGLSVSKDTLVVFTSDHGESLGEHDYWGHGRHLYEPALRIPLAFYWPGRLEPQVVEHPALILDIAPTVLGLIGIEPPSEFEGFDWSGVLRGEGSPPERIARFQAHKGAVISRHDSDLARGSGLLEVGLISGNRKEIFRIAKRRHRLFDLAADPTETIDLTRSKQDPSETLLGWMQVVVDGLVRLDETPPEPLDEESIEQLRALGYVD